MSMWAYPVPTERQANIAQVGRQQDAVKLTTGLFTVPTVPPGNPSALHLYVSNFNDVEVGVAFSVNKLTSDGWGKENVFTGQTTAPPHGVADVELHGVSEETLEVVVEITAFLGVAVSVDVIETFAADGATLPLVMIPPGRFAGLPISASVTRTSAGEKNATEGSAKQSLKARTESLSGLTFTSGVFDVPQGVAAARPQVHLMLSNFSDQPQSVTVEVNTLFRGSSEKHARPTQQVSVAPRGATALLIEDVEGLPIEVNVTLPILEEGFVPLEASINVTELFLSDNTIDSLLYIGPTDFTPSD